MPVFRYAVSVVLVLLILHFQPGDLVAAERADGAVRLTTPAGSASDQNPAFSPDGTQLLFTRFEHGYNDGPAGLFVLDLASGAIRRITPVEDQDNVNLPGSAWNKGTDRIVFSSDRAEADDLWQVAADGSGLQRITEHTTLGWYLEPSWSPDGAFIVFELSVAAATADGRRGEIWKVAADGTGLVALIPESLWDDRQPNWSPRGDRIVFQRRSLNGDTWALYSIASDGTELRLLIDDPDSDDSDASWSPDGKAVIFSSTLGVADAPVITSVRVAGGPISPVTCEPGAWDGAPSWSPDGTWIAFESHADDEAPAALWGMRLSDSVCYVEPPPERVRRGRLRFRPGG